MELAEYNKKITEILNDLAAGGDQYDKAAEKMADAVCGGGLIHFFGTDMHTSPSVDEVFFRFGSLASVNPMYDPSMSVNHSAARALYVKECSGCGTFMVEYYRNLSKGDTLVLVDNYAGSRFAVETARKAGELGIFVVAVTSSEFTAAVPEGCAFSSPDGKTLLTPGEVPMLIDNRVPPFDALDEQTGEGWVSAIANSFVLNALMMATRKVLRQRNFSADAWQNFYSDKGAARNSELIDEYIYRVKHI